MKLLEFINKKTNNAYKDFKLVSVIFSETDNSCTFKFLYNTELLKNAKTELVALIREYFGEDITIIVKCKKAYIDEDLVRDVIYNFIIRNYSSLVIGFTKGDIKVNIEDQINVEILCNNFQYEHMINNLIHKEIADYANLFFFEEFNLALTVQKNDVEEEIIPTITIDTNVESETGLKYHRISEITPFIGEVVGCPIQILSIKSALQNIEVAGELKYLSQKSFESKRKDKDGNTIIRNYLAFSIFDGTGRINCVYFPNKADLSKIENLEEGQNIIVSGEVEEFGERLSFKVKSIGFAEILNEVEVEEIAEVVKGPNDNYNVVFPEPYIDIFQDNLFAVKPDVGEYLKNHDVVVFDIETTGLDASKCEIIEIGAVKIKNGKVAETFETLIKPNSTIPDEIIELTGITPDMVANSPNIKQVMPDFYKFCYGCTIMAYNIDFDYKFINLFGQKLGYIFDNRQIDVLFLARSFIPGLKNFKLSTVCKKLGVSLENAHRAVHDALATAEVVLKLGPNIT